MPGARGRPQKIKIRILAQNDLLTMMRYAFIAIVLLLLTAACRAPLGYTETLWMPPPQEPVPPTTARRAAPADAEAYEPDTAHLDHTPIKYIRVNVHWMNNAAKTANLDDWRAVNYTKGMIHAANYALENNRAMWLPYGNETPLLPTRFRYVLTGRPDDPNDDGIYFHYDDTLYYYVHIGRRNANYSSRRVVDKYGVQLDTVLNLFVMPYHVDSMYAPNFRGEQVGVALGNAVKIAGPWLRMWGQDPESYWQTRGNINHEVGHIYGLAHAWNTNDGCDDTPRHSQKCFNKDSGPGCDTLTSNNVMDYCALQVAWTPCQIGRVLMRMADESAKTRRLLQPNWCTLHPDRTIWVADTVVWRGAKDLEGELTIMPGGRLVVQNRVSLPAGARIIVEPGGELALEEGARLHNACGDTWAGVVIREKNGLAGRVSSAGRVTVENLSHQENR